MSDGRPTPTSIPHRRYYLPTIRHFCNFTEYDAPLHFTSLDAVLLPLLARACWYTAMTPDRYLWANHKGIKYLDKGKTDKPPCVSITGMPGRGNDVGSVEHHQRTYGAKPDPDLAKLREWVGDDVDLYAYFGGGTDAVAHRGCHHLTTPSPTVTFVTRHYGGNRERLLMRLCRSLSLIRSRSWEHVIIDGTECNGDTDRANRLFVQHAGRVRGEWVFMIDDDDLVLDETMVDVLASVDAEVVFCRGFIGGHGVLPHPWGDQSKLRFGSIGLINFCVRRSVWLQHIAACADSHGGDWRFLESVIRSPHAYRVGWIDRQFACAPLSMQGHEERHDLTAVELFAYWRATGHPMNMAISEACAETITRLVAEYGVRSSMESGSGVSTLLLASCVEHHTALENNPKVREDVQKGLWLHGLDAFLPKVSLVGSPKWYANGITPRPVDLILIDGPVGRIGRHGAIDAVGDWCHKSTIIVVDDTHREAERRIASIISSSRKMTVASTDGAHGYSVLYPT